MMKLLMNICTVIILGIAKLAADMGEIDAAFRAWGFARGGTGGISEAIASSARALGAEVRCNARVAEVIVNRDEAIAGLSQQR